MKKTLAATVAALMLAAAAPAMAQSMDTLFPRLTWPDDGVTVSTKGCDAAPAAPACTPSK